MKIDEAIAQAREVAKTKYRESAVIMIDGNNSFETKSKYNTCIECAEEHEQLAEWLEELKAYRNHVFSGEMTQSMLKEERNKAIDDFAEKAIQEFTRFDLEHGYPTVADCKDVLQDVAEQLKAGDTDAESI